MDVTDPRLLVLVNVLYQIVIFRRARSRYWRRLSLLYRSHADRMKTTHTMWARRQYLRNRKQLSWSFPKPLTCWLDHTLNEEAIPERVFRERVRLERRTFRKLLRILLAKVERQNTVFRLCTTPSTMLAAALYQLAHGNSFRATADIMNIGQATVHDAFWDVVHTLNDIKDMYIKFPLTREDKIRTIDTFKDLTLLPNVLADIDVTHLCIIAPGFSIMAS